MSSVKKELNIYKGHQFAMFSRSLFDAVQKIFIAKELGLAEILI